MNGNFWNYARYSRTTQYAHITEDEEEKVKSLLHGYDAATARHEITFPQINSLVSLACATHAQSEKSIKPSKRKNLENKTYENYCIWNRTHADA